MAAALNLRCRRGGDRGETFRAYVRAQRRIGVPSLYHATHVDRFPPWTKERTHFGWSHYLQLQIEEGFPVHEGLASQEELTDEDYGLVRDAWAGRTTRNPCA